MSKLLDAMQANPLVWVLALLVAALLVHFLIQYVLRALGLRSLLIDLTTRVKALGSHAPEAIKPRLDEVFRDRRLERAWREFEESLHEQRSGLESEAPVISIRATQPAEAFFNVDSVVDPWVGAEYFKHLPGILTGLGIIGTFFGLIQGLIHFDPSLSDSAELRRGLNQLFTHVRDAFTFSGLAIAAAIAVTFVEKWLYASCARWLLELATTLDAMFKTGVGEEYLAALLKSSQDSRTEMRDLKQSVGGELRGLLTHLCERQLHATQQMSADLGRSIRESLQEPLADIAHTVALASGRDVEGMRNVLEQLMSSFLEQMRETMGKQMADLSGLIHQATSSVYKMEMAMQSLLADVQQSGHDAAARMHTAVQELARRLSESHLAQGETLSTAMKSVLARLNEALARLAAEHEEAMRRIREGNEAASGKIASAAKSHATVIEATRDLLDRFNGASNQMISRLSASTAAVVSAATALQQASDQLSRVGAEIAAVQDQAHRSSQEMTRASSQLAATAHTVGNSIEKLNSVAVRFEGVASSAGVEANARRQLLISLQDVIDQSHTASREFVNLAQEARKALGASVEHFESDVSSVLAGHVKTYQRQLGDSVIALRHALDQLAVRAARVDRN